jgi:hypothetical protein
MSNVTRIIKGWIYFLWTFFPIPQEVFQIESLNFWLLSWKYPLRYRFFLKSVRFISVEKLLIHFFIKCLSWISQNLRHCAYDCCLTLKMTKIFWGWCNRHVDKSTNPFCWDWKYILTPIIRIIYHLFLRIIYIYLSKWTWCIIVDQN